MHLEPLDLPHLGRDVAAFEQVAKRRPLSLWRAWGDPEHDLEAGRHVPQGGRTTQRRALQELQHTRVLVVFGGVRSGKTELLRAANAAIGIGSDHPDAIEFWRANGCDPSWFPPGPGCRVRLGSSWSVARTSSDSTRYNRQQLLSLLPKWGPPHPKAERGESWRALNIDGRGESSIEVMVPGYDWPAEFFFKSEDQGLDSFDGDACRVIHHDEEGRTGAVWDRAKARLTDWDGWHLLSDAPVKGRTWVYNRFEREIEEDTRVVRLWSVDNPYLPRKRAALLDRDPVRGRGEFVVAKGRIWPQFSREVHVLPPLAKRLQAEHPDWPRYRFIDFGLRDPHVVHWVITTKGVIDIAGRRIPERSAIVYREHYKVGLTLAQHVEHYRAVEGWVRCGPGDQGEGPRSPDGRWRRPETAERIAMSWADPEDAQQIMSLNVDHGLVTAKATKDREAGINAVAEWLTPDATGEPRLYVCEDCPETIREWLDYIEVQDEVDRDGVPTHRPSGQSDHTCDLARYEALALRYYV